MNFIYLIYVYTCVMGNFEIKWTHSFEPYINIRPTLIDANQYDHNFRWYLSSFAHFPQNEQLCHSVVVSVIVFGVLRVQCKRNRSAENVRWTIICQSEWLQLILCVPSWTAIQNAMSIQLTLEWSKQSLWLAAICKLPSGAGWSKCRTFTQTNHHARNI